MIHFNVTRHPTAQWTAHQVTEALPWDVTSRYLLRDRDGIYGEDFRDCVRKMGIEEVLTAPRSPWQNAYSERLNGSVRRECLDHVIVFNEAHLRRILREYFDYYNGDRTHLSLEMDAPEGRDVRSPAAGRIVALPRVGGLHRRYDRLAA